MATKAIMINHGMKRVYQGKASSDHHCLNGELMMKRPTRNIKRLWSDSDFGFIAIDALPMEPTIFASFG